MNYYEHTYIASQSLNNKDLSDLHQKMEEYETAIVIRDELDKIDKNG